MNNNIKCKWVIKNFGTSSYCIVRIQHSGTAIIEGDITKTGQKLTIGKCVLWKKLMFPTVNTKYADGLRKFFKNLVNASVEAVKKITKNVFKNPGRAIGVGAKTGSTVISRNQKAAFSAIPDVIKFSQTGKRLYLGELV